MKEVLTEFSLPGFFQRSRKVREIIEISPELKLLLIISTDRISAFDVVLPTGIPDKGKF